MERVNFKIPSNTKCIKRKWYEFWKPHYVISPNNNIEDSHTPIPSVPTIITLHVTKEDMESLIRIREYFYKDNKTVLGKLAGDILSRFIKE